MEYHIRVNNIEKRFRREWIFREFSFDFFNNESYALTGPNGSGKSTLLLILAGLVPATSGKIEYYCNNNNIPPEDFFRYINLAAPYSELIEEFTLQEFLEFHFQFKKLATGYTISNIISSLSLETAKNKPIKQFSSGMKQRVKLGAGFYADCPILLLDEPCSNLDAKGITWYKTEIEKIRKNKLIIICSNQSYEYDFCKKIISLENFKY